MIESSWRVDEPSPGDRAATSGEQPTLVSLHFLRAALRRRWRVWAGLAVIAMLLGLGVGVAMPAPSAATVTLLLAHDPESDPTTAMATDVSLLRTRAVAEAVIDKLQLELSPEAFQSSVTVSPDTPSVLVLTVAAQGREEALARVKALTRAYLGFRTAQLRIQTEAQVGGYQKNIAALQKQVNALTAQYNLLSAGGPASQGQAADVLSQRTQLGSQISSIQRTIEDATLKTGSIVGASHVLDPVSEVPRSSRRRIALDMVSGLVVGTALGVGLVILVALTSDRLRRREEVALALSTPVRFSVGHLRRRRLLPARRRSSAERALQVLVHGLDSSVAARPGRRVRVLVGAVQNGRDAELIVSALGIALGHRGMAAFLVDLSEAGNLASTVSNAGAPAFEVPLVVYRPPTVPSLLRGPFVVPPALADGVPADAPDRGAWEAADVVVTLAEIDPAVGVDHLKSWADQLVLLVTAGRSSAERLRTIAGLLRAADLRLAFAMMVGADRNDESLGLAGVPEEARARPRTVVAR